MNKAQEQQIKKRNVELEKKLAAKNRELKIETALEKVRAVALSMKAPADMLKICKTISLQLQSLGVKEIRNVQTAIFYDSRGTYMNYEFYAKHNKTFITETVYTNHKVAKAFAAKMLKGKGEFYITHIKGKKVKEWIAYQKTTNVFIDKYLNTASSLNYYWFSLGPVALGISTYHPLTKEEENLFKRFLNVFELSYRRYLDIEKAEAQAREVQIELALERVRARTMAMQKSDELPQTTFLLFHQLKELGETAAQLSIGIVKEEERFVELSATVHGNPMLQTYRIPIDEPFMMKKAVKAWKAKKKTSVIELEGKELKDYNKWRNSVLKKKIGFPEKKWIVNLVYFSKGMLSFSSDKKISKETLQLLERFAGVFDGTYTRFLDLQKAEAQVKEAKIEAALERVRSRSLAMHHSSELSAVVDTLLREFNNLEFTLTFCIINLINEKDKSNTVWAANPEAEKAPESYYMKFEDYPFHYAMWDAWKAQKKRFVYTMEGEEKKIYDQYLYSETEFSRFPQNVKEANMALERYVAGFTFFKYSGLQTVSINPISEEDLSILERFGRVFEQSYTRFLDLQKAEAQAREAQIEASLERVRSRSMAMHKSDELKEAGELLWNELGKLGIESLSSGYALMDKEEKISWIYAPNPSTGKIAEPLGCLHTETKEMRAVLSSWKKQELLSVIEMDEQETITHQTFIAERALNLDGTISRWITAEQLIALSPKRLFLHNFNFKEGYLLIVGGSRLNEEQKTLMLRFTKVFQQTYTRFLDLQKAEAQARESQIEAALERVRSRTMGMQKSDELKDVAVLLYRQFLSLGVSSVLNCGYVEVDEINNIQHGWMTKTDGTPSESFHLPLTGDPIFQDRYDSWKRKDSVFHQIVGADEMKRHIEFSRPVLPSKEVEELVVTKFPDPTIFYCGNFSNGYLHVITGTLLSKNEENLLERFTRVFDQTYTRFLDLQKAEAQAREAKIEAALERVRAKTMAMHKSSDMLDVVKILGEQFELLGFKFQSVNFDTDFLEKDWNLWLYNVGSAMYPGKIHIPYIDHPCFNRPLEAFKKGGDLHSFIFTKEEKDSFFDHIYANSVAKYGSDERKKFTYAAPGFALSIAVTKNTRISIANYNSEPFSEDENTILRRFANVFEQSYTRFLDLQKAEAQAREAQIELGLERVRARAMAMQKSDELKELIGTVFIELTKLDLVLTRCLIMIYDPMTNGSTWWMANSEAPTDPIGLFIKYHEHTPYLAYIKGWQERNLKWQYVLEGTDKNEWDDFLFIETELSHLPDFVIAGMKAPDRVYLNASFNNFGNLTLASLESLSDEHFDILLRFAKVFDLTYTRFNDLQKAEAQAREAQIEASLERVRSRSMGMQKSEELKEVIQVVYDQFVHLNILIEHTGFLIDYKERDDMHIWLADQHLVPSEVTIPYFDSPPNNSIKEAKEKGKDFFTYHLTFEEKNKFYRDLFKFVPGVPEETLEYYFNCPGLAGSGVLLDTIGLYIENFSGTPYTGEENNVLMRFGKVFQQTYTRFLDLQKAEAQAREAKIEAALERVRSRSLAMHKSDELPDVVRTVFDRLNELDIIMNAASIFIFKEGSNDLEQWVALSGHQYSTCFHLSYFNFSMFRDLKEARKKGKDSYVKKYSFQEKNEWFSFAFEHTDYSQLPDARKKYLLESDSAVFSYALTKNAGLQLANYDGQLFSETEIEVLKRFAKVFEQAYTRFLDLQKAEAQVREAQIEAGLERVRARTMAMHNSEDVSTATATMFVELEKLGIKNLRGGITIINPDQTQEVWSITNMTDGKTIRAIGVFDMKLHPLWRELFKAKENKSDYHYYRLAGKDKENYIAILNATPNYLSQPIKEIPDVHVQSYFFGEGGIWTNSLQPHSEEDKQIMKRFASVFSLTFRRYQDLKKAEAQAREAQIEAALERVRSKSLAMHHSNNLHEVIAVVTEQFQQLGFHFDTANFITNYTETGWDMWVSTPGVAVPAQIYVPYIDIKFFNELNNAVRRGDEFYTVILSKEEKNEFFNHFFQNTNAKYIPEERKKYVLYEKGLAVSAVLSKKVFLDIVNYQAIPYTEEENAILLRFAHVFEQSYIRFLDLQKAEAQAKEAKIEAALERVRSRTMAMHKSDELAEAAAVLFQQFNELGAAPERMNIGIVKEDGKVIEFWSTEQGGKQIGHLFKGDIDEPTTLAKAYHAWKEKKRSIVIDLSGDELTAWISYLRDVVKMPVNEELIKGRRVHTAACFAQGMILMTTPEPLPDDAVNLLERFATVFNLTYRRFLDLQKAEAQAREAQIEASLERVRSKTMAMHNSQDVGDTVATMFAEFVNLGIYTNRCGILIFNNRDSAEVWTARSNPEGKATLIIGKLDLNSHKLLSSVYEAWKAKESFYQYDLLDDDLKRYYETINKSEYYHIKFDIESLPSKEFHSDFFFPEGAVFAFTGEQVIEDHSKIIKRFAGVFGQTYRRYLDLQKAEAQAREAQIEGSLERIRARSMSMRSSVELLDVIKAIAEQLTLLNLKFDNVSFGSNIQDENFKFWLSAAGQPQPILIEVPYLDNPAPNRVKEAQKNGVKFFADVLTEDENKKWTQHLIDHSDVKFYSDKVKQYILNAVGYARSTFILNNINLYIGNYHAIPYTKEENHVFNRFAQAFEQSYTRFLDLQKAEAQAREATIEVALEKVRGKAMAMHNSNDLSVTASLVFTELRKLGINSIRSGFGSLHKEYRRAQLYSATSSADGDSLSLVGWVELSGHPVLEKIYDAWLRNEEYYPELIGEQLKLYYESLLAGLQVPVPDWQNGQKQYGNFFPFSVGCLYAWSEVPYNEDEIKILKRFASIIDLTFRRYLELQKSEANAKEAIKQAALDRIRADIASMRTISDLDRITPLIWNELTILGIPFIRCGVFIMDESQQLIHTFLSTPDGKAIAAFHLPYDTPGNIGQVLSNWKTRSIYTDHWDEEEFNRFADILVKQGALDSAEKYLKTIPHGGFYLHFLPFLQGMLYVGNTNQLSNEEINLIQSIADAFSTAYARYEDFNKLEAAKQQVDKTLVDLKQAQQQLVQSEKMASLGELTAGIAHEIQNPLNFVNNFSEVSKELLDEMKAELDSGNLDDAKEIMNDVIQNLEKINHHGKRADGIVKGMLQHSRSSSATKEPTDINALADEYLRLSYHGLRAKDKSFNATMKTDFDESLEKINIVPQDIGRVILNLLTNAFYVVSQKAKQNIPGYEPTVSVNTKKVDNKVEIKITDNGNGIPQKVLDKIFQPFFTTKPTGQGTGLGLSLSYDIVKAHGGEIKVETKEGEGTEFIVQLPLIK